WPGDPLRQAHGHTGDLEESQLVAEVGGIVEIDLPLYRMVEGEAESLGLFATKPRLGQGDRVVLEGLTVGLYTKRQLLSVAYRERIPLAEVSDIFDREVVEHQSDCTYESVESTPTAREFDLVIWSFFQFKGDIHGRSL